MLLLLLSFIIIGANYIRTGEIIGRDISLKGGTIVTITTIVMLLLSLIITTMAILLLSQVLALKTSLNTKKKFLI